ncbi:MAG: hypothetical protein KAS32_27495 [Candidatus Peribacteraceae bacterium]|nr:hypothetical protein [Candidatus Peribacteraceae bacterium]
MDVEKIVKAFDEFSDGKYADSEDTIRSEVRQTVNDFLKTKLDLVKDPIQPEEGSNDNEE